MRGSWPACRLRRRRRACTRRAFRTHLLALLATQLGRGRTGALGEAVVADRMVEHYMSWLLTVFR